MGSNSNPVLWSIGKPRSIANWIPCWLTVKSPAVTPGFTRSIKVRSVLGRSILSEVFMAVGVLNRLVRIRDGKALGSGLPVDNVVGTGHHVEVAHLMDNRAGL